MELGKHYLYVNSYRGYDIYYNNKKDSYFIAKGDYLYNKKYYFINACYVAVDNAFAENDYYR